MPTQTGSIDFTSAGGLKSYAAGQFATQGTVTDMQTQIDQNADAIALRATKTEAYQVAQPNLSPYYSSVPYASTNTYWKSIQLENGFTFTSMGDGWMRVQCTNSGSSVIRRDWYPIKCPSVIAGQPYTWLAEVRNNASSSVSSNSDFYLVQTNNLQFWGQKAIKTIEGPSGSGMSVNIGTCGSTYTLRKVQNAETADGGHWTNNDEANVVGLACWTFRCAANSTIDYEVRLSVYEGEYTGPYKPYSGTQLYASQAELKVQADRIGMVVSNADASSSLQLTPAAITAVTDNLTIKDSSGSATVISGGKIQANSLTIGDMSADTQADILNSNVVVGGRNLLRYAVYNYADANGVIGVYSSYRGMYCAVDGGETYTISRRTVEGNRFWIEWSEQEPAAGVALNSLSRNNTALKVTVDVPSEANWLFIYLSNQSDVINDGNIKVERGNKATDWTPAPEDVESSIIEASKTASNYITADSTGIKIHMSGSTSTYQHQSSTATTYYVNGNKRAEVGANGLKVYVGTTGSESSVAEFGTTARVGSASGPNVYVESGGVSVRDGTTGVVKFSGAAESGYYTRSSSVELAGWNGTALKMMGSASTNDRFIGLESGFNASMSVTNTDSLTDYGSFDGHGFIDMNADGLSVNGTTVDMDKQVLPAFLEQSGMVSQSISATANAVTSHTVTFPIPYAVSPIVTACFYSTSTAAAFGGLSLSVSAITTTSFTVKIFNNTGTGRTVGIFWIAAPQTTLT